MQTSNVIGKIVLSSNFGLGKVVSIDDLGMGGKDYLVIECRDSNVKNFIPIDDKSAFRFLTELKEFNKSIERLGTDNISTDFESKKDRIEYFKSASQKQDLDSLIRVILELKAIEDRGTVEEQIFSKLIDNLALEYSVLKDEEEQASREQIESLLVKSAA